MPEASIDNGKRPGAFPDMLRHPISTLQERLDALEHEARDRLARALSTGNEKLAKLDEALARVTKDDWSVPAMRRHLDVLRARAESFRTTAMKRVSEMPGEAVTRIATGSRTPVQNLAKSLADMAKRFEAAPRAERKPERPRPEKARPERAKPEQVV